MNNEVRDLTAAEKRAVGRLEKALAAIPNTLAIYFEAEGSFFVFDRETWSQGPGVGEGWGGWVQDKSIDSRPIGCRYDVGAL